uniref:UBC core domain-containing protein n=1 Tax=Sciurus vulgaris TaxID=55149 RepID=A0A8D2CNU5_SCIVU
MVVTVFKRLMANYKQLTLNPPEGIVVGPMNEENFFEWEALIIGPQNTNFEFSVSLGIMTFSLDYPLSPLKRFTCKMFHPNIYPHPRVCPKCRQHCFAVCDLDATWMSLTADRAKQHSTPRRHHSNHRSAAQEADAWPVLNRLYFNRSFCF